MTGIRSIEIFGQNDEYLCVHGVNAGNRGCYLEEDHVHGIYDSPEKQKWAQGARQKKSKQKSRKPIARDMDLGFIVKETTSHTYEENESYLIQAVGYELDKYNKSAKYARLAVTTDLSGTRYLDILQYEEPDFAPKQDSIKHQLGKPLLKVRSGNPDWYEKPVVKTCVMTADGEGEIEVSNPTNREMNQSWVITCPTGVVVSLPDFSWYSENGGPGSRRPDGADAERMVALPALRDSDGGGIVVDLDMDQVRVRSKSGTNIQARMGAQAFLHRIPDYTQPQMLPILVDGLTSGEVTVELVQPRFWSRPWGLEYIA